MKVDTTSGPGGLSLLKEFWDFNKPHIQAIRNGLMLGRIDIIRLNFGIVTRIPKVTELRTSANSGH
jgi:hypothetical protein